MQGGLKFLQTWEWGRFEAKKMRQGKHRGIVGLFLLAGAVGSSRPWALRMSCKTNLQTYRVVVKKFGSNHS